MSYLNRYVTPKRTSIITSGTFMEAVRGTISKLCVKAASLRFFAVIPAYSRRATVFPILKKDAVTFMVCQEAKKVSIT